jgi:hypothetical protein
MGTLDQAAEPSPSGLNPVSPPAAADRTRIVLRAATLKEHSDAVVRSNQRHS